MMQRIDGCNLKRLFLEDLTIFSLKDNSYYFQIGLNNMKTSNPPPQVKSLFDQLLDSVTSERSPTKTTTEEIKEMKKNRLNTPSHDIPILTLDGDGLEVVEVVANSSTSSNNTAKKKPKPKSDHKPEPKEILNPFNPNKSKNATKTRKPRVSKPPQPSELIPEVSSDDSSSLEYELNKTSREYPKLPKASTSTGPSQSSGPLSYREKSLARKAASKKDVHRKDAPLFEVQPAPPANQSTLSSWVVPKQPTSKSYTDIPAGPSSLAAAAPPTTPAMEGMEVDESPDKITPLEDLAPLMEYLNNDQADDFAAFENSLFEGISAAETSAKLDELLEYVSKHKQKAEKERKEAEAKAQNAMKTKKLYEMLRACSKQPQHESRYGDPQFQSTEIWSPQSSSNYSSNDYRK